MSGASWKGFRSVLCAIDFSEQSRRALRRSADVAARAGGRLTVLFVNDPLLVASAAVARPRFDLGAHSLRELARFVRTTLGSRASVRVRHRVVTGEPAHQILTAAKAGRADLIVVGSQGLTGIARWMFGSTTAAVLKRAQVPVLVVPGDGGSRHHDVHAWPRGRTLAPVMLDRRTAADVDSASRVAEWFGGSLLLVHVVTTSVAPPWLRRRLPGEDAGQLERARQRLAAIAASVTRLQTDVRVVAGHPADAAARVAKRERTPLLITNLRDRRHWFAPGRGSVTYRLMTQVDVPILACPPRWKPR